MVSMSNDPIEHISTDAAPPPGGHYSQATVWRDLVFVSGQSPVPLSGGHSANRLFEEQAGIALDSLFAVLAAVGAGPEDVLEVTAYILGTENRPRFNTLYPERFGAARPARAVVPVPAFHYGYLIELGVVAVRATSA